ncbi:endothelial lipase-like [Planococcus citri]|uniref:endothelial lipase-like n=1 Tax=Planococcus citri TaxID=170843 RepID=UPI0031F7E903
MFAYISIVSFVAIMVCTKHVLKFKFPQIFVNFYTFRVDQPPHELAVVEPDTIKYAPIIPNADFKFVLHGFMQWKNCPMWLELREGEIFQRSDLYYTSGSNPNTEYFKQKPWNIIFIDYSPLARDGCYIDSTFPSIPTVGECAANMIKFLLKTRPEIRIEQFHLIGFSMGAQLAAQVAMYLKPLRLQRITGLDPAFPFFTPGFVKKENTLNKNHARFVDVIHSNMGIFGVYYSDATYDIYLNNGAFQPGCDPCNIFRKNSKFIFKIFFNFSRVFVLFCFVLVDPACSHTRAPLVFNESINSPKQFIADKCDSKTAWLTIRKCTGDHAEYIGVGEHSKPPRSSAGNGIYKMKTNEKRPYYKQSW